LLNHLKKQPVARILLIIKDMSVVGYNMEKEIKIKPIGIIHTPYKEPKGIPIQGKFEKGIIGQIEIFPEYQQGLKDIEGFSHIILIYYFNRSKDEKLTGRPYLEDELHGIFAIRSPNRPNHIGFSIVKLEKVKDNIITFSEVDILDGTPLLDIKPYVLHFDSRKNVKNGWLEKHFKTDKIPRRAKLK
jgi:tRNA-Thr(GGU) m(6)t(6)A37 methyltransferase TsaA